PGRSETFLLNELLALDARGALAAVFATKPGDGGPLHPGCRRLLRRVEVLPGGSPSAQAASLLERLGARRVAGVHGYFAHRPAAVAAHDSLSAADRRRGTPARAPRPRDRGGRPRRARHARRAEYPRGSPDGVCAGTRRRGAVGPRPKR